MEIEEFASRLENYLRYGNVRGPKKTIPVSKVPFCPFSAAMSLKYDIRFYGERNGGKIMGTILHTGLLNTIKESWQYLSGGIEEKPRIEEPVQYELRDGWVLSGRADLIIGDHLFEFKFIHEYPYSQIERITDPTELDEGNILNAYIEQTNAYLHMFNGVRHGHLWIFKRNDIVPWKKLPVEKDDKKFEEFIERAKKIIDIVNGLDRNEVPSFEPRFDWECRNCIYKPICPRQFR